MDAATAVPSVIKTIKTLCVAGVLLFSHSYSVANTESVQDLRYGVSLYHFYQQNYFDALTELMAAQELKQLPGHQANAELLEGGMSLSYGLDRKAEQIFKRLLSEPVAGVDRSKAWFFLGKLQYQRGDSARASTSLKNMGATDDAFMAQEADYLKARLLLNAGDISGSTALVTTLPPDSPWLPYYYYNLGVVEISKGNTPAGVSAFKQLESLPIINEEEKALRDRAYTASGFANMSIGDLEQAKQDFSKVRIESPLVDRALLGYGWASAQQNDYRAALSPWQQLSKGSLLYPSVQESLLAVPFAYETLGAQTNALVHYQAAVQAYQDEIVRINAAINIFDQQSLDELFKLSSSKNDEWLIGGEILPINKHAPYIAQLIASHKFQQAIKELRDLNRMTRYLGRAQERLSVLKTVDVEQQDLWQEVIDQSRIDLLRNRERELSLVRDDLHAQLAAAVAENDGKQLGGEDQVALWKKIEQAEQRVDKLASAGQDVSQARQKIRVFRGLMTWEDSENYPVKLWEHQKELRSVENISNDTAAALQRIEQLIDSRDRSVFSPRIAELDARVNSYQLQVATSTTETESRIRTLAVSELKQQERRLSHYMTQAKLAIARLYDRGSIENLQ